MKYVNKFSTNTDYQAFAGGEDYVTPNVCYVEETNGIIVKPEINENNTLQFPIYLVYGDNGQVGIDLYNYLLEKGGIDRTGDITNEVIYYDNLLAISWFHVSEKNSSAGRAYCYIYLDTISAHGAYIQIDYNGSVFCYSSGNGGGGSND